jgi:hypothetical protein
LLRALTKSVATSLKICSNFTRDPNRETIAKPETFSPHPRTLEQFVVSTFFRDSKERRTNQKVHTQRRIKTTQKIRKQSLGNALAHLLPTITHSGVKNMRVCRHRHQNSAPAAGGRLPMSVRQLVVVLLLVLVQCFHMAQAQSGSSNYDNYGYDDNDGGGGGGDEYGNDPYGSPAGAAPQDTLYHDYAQRQQAKELG